MQFAENQFQCNSKNVYCIMLKSNYTKLCFNSKQFKRIDSRSLQNFLLVKHETIIVGRRCCLCLTSTIYEILCKLHLNENSEDLDIDIMLRALIILYDLC